MTEPLAALFDVEVLRGRREPVLAALGHASPLLVLGSAQSLGSLELSALHDDGVALRRRRGGGGAVLLDPSDAWVEVWLPRDQDVGGVRAVATRVGGWWAQALSGAGLATEQHDDGVDHPDDGRVACFAATGPGELTAGGRKILGLSQWRVREGTLVSCVLAQVAPDGLSRYLRDGAIADSLRRRSTSLTELGTSLDAHTVRRAFVELLRTDVPAVEVVEALDTLES